MFTVLTAVVFSAGLWLWLLYRYDKVEPESIKTLLYIGLLGGLLSVVPASIFNDLFRHTAGIQDIPFEEYHTLGNTVLLAFSFFVGINEEICKAAAAVLLLRRHRAFNEPIDALIYSMTVALGFAAFENIFYALREGLDVLVVRSLTAVPLHMGLASFWGIGIAKAKYLKRGKYFNTVTPYVLAAAAIHGVYDYFVFRLPNRGMALLIALALTLTIILISRRRLIYFLGQSSFVEAGTCPYCHTENTMEDLFCKRCGRSLVQEYLTVCPTCGEKEAGHARFCGKCGEEMESPA
jgi:RsiW-degrading membrane proteinase PrsW (M82 family)